MVVHFHNAAFANRAVMRPLGFVRVAASTDTFRSSGLSFVACVLRGAIGNEGGIEGVGDGLGVWGDGAGVGGHGLEVRNNGHGGDGAVETGMKQSAPCHVTYAILVEVAHPGREEDCGDGVSGEYVKGVREGGAEEAAAVRVEPIFVKGGGTKGLSNDGGYGKARGGDVDGGIGWVSSNRGGRGRGGWFGILSLHDDDDAADDGKVNLWQGSEVPSLNIFC